MSKKITSPVSRWEGTVTIADPLTIPQAKLIEAGLEPPVDSDEQSGRIWLTVIDEKQLPAVLGCVEKWELENFPQNVTEETFPASPRGDSHKLISAIFRALMAVYSGEAEVPNE